MQLFGAHLAILRLQQGRGAELEEMIAETVRQHPTVPSWRCLLASLYAEQERRAEARREFEQLAAHDFTDLPRDNLWLASLSFLAEACANLGDAARATHLYEMLRPFAAHWVVISFGVACRGAVARYLGLCAATAGRDDEAAQYFEQALEAHDRTRAWPWLAFTQYDYARLLAARDPDRARALAAQALATARACGMQGLAARAARLSA
jgi:tetratricopeptide (TPR) repeat protein